MATRNEIRVTRELINQFGSQMAASRALHMHERTVRWWCQHGAPPHVFVTLARYKDGEISLRWARHLLRARRTRRTLNGRRRRA